MPSVGARLCLLIALLGLVAAGYFLLAPVQVHSGNGRAFDCGTVLNPPASKFAVGICGSVNDIAASRAIALGVGSLLVAVGGFVVFGLERRTQTRRARPPEDDAS